MIKTVVFSSVLTALFGLGVVAAAVHLGDAQHDADKVTALTVQLPARSLPEVAARPVTSWALPRTADKTNHVQAALAGDAANGDAAALAAATDIPPPAATDFAPAGGVPIGGNDAETSGVGAGERNKLKEKKEISSNMLAEDLQVPWEDPGASQAAALAASLAATDVEPTPEDVAASLADTDSDGRQSAAIADGLRGIDWTATPLPETPLAADDGGAGDPSPPGEPIRLPGAISLRAAASSEEPTVIAEPVAPKVFAERVIVNRRSNLRQAPTVESAILGKLGVGDLVIRTTETPVEGYHRVVDGDVQGWVWWLNVEPAEEPPATGGEASFEVWRDTER